MASGRAIKATTVTGASPSHSSTLWPLPVQQADGSWKPGAWVSARRGERVQYRSNGLHLCAPAQLGYWVKHFAAARRTSEPVELRAWVVEYEGACDVGLHGIAVRRARLVRPYVAGEAL